MGLSENNLQSGSQPQKIKVKEAGCDGNQLQPTDDLIREKENVSLYIMYNSLQQFSVKSRFSSLFYSYSAALREVRCFRKTPFPVFLKNSPGLSL